MDLDDIITLEVGNFFVLAPQKVVSIVKSTYITILSIHVTSFLGLGESVEIFLHLEIVIFTLLR